MAETVKIFSAFYAGGFFLSLIIFIFFAIEAGASIAEKLLGVLALLFWPIAIIIFSGMVIASFIDDRRFHRSFTGFSSGTPHWTTLTTPSPAQDAVTLSYANSIVENRQDSTPPLHYLSIGETITSADQRILNSWTTIGPTKNTIEITEKIEENYVSIEQRKVKDDLF